MILSEKTQQQIHFWTLAASIVLLLPFPPLSSLAVVLCLLNWIIGGRFLKLGRLKHPLPLLFSSLYFIYLIGMIYTDNTALGWRNLETKLTLLLFPLLFFTGNKLNAKQRDRLVISFAWSTLIVSLFSFGSAIFTLISTGEFTFAYKKLAAHIGAHPAYFALYAGFACFIFFFKYIKNAERRSSLNYIIPLLSAAYLLLFVFMLSARMIMLGMLLLIGVSILIYALRRGMFLRGLSFLTLGFVLLSGVLWTLPTTRMRLQKAFLADEKQPAYRNIRFQLWDAALDVYQKDFIIGQGTGDVQTELDKIYEQKNYTNPLGAHLNLHNQYLQTLAALGVVGLLIFLNTLIIPFIIAVKRRHYLYLLFLGLFIIANLTESMLERQHGVMFFSFFLSLFAVDLLQKNNKEEKIS